MTLTINATIMTSDQTLDRNTATTLADIAAETGLHQGHRLWPHIQSWAAELGLTGPDAITRASEPAEKISSQEPGNAPPDPEAEP